MEANITLLKESLNSAEDQVAMTRANYNAGLVPELTLLQAQVAMENLKPAILEMENGLSVMQSSFAILLGLPFSAVIKLASIETSDYIDLDVRDLITKATNVNPEILQAKQAITATQSMQKILKLRHYTPSLILNWNAGPAFTKDPLKDSWFDDADDWSDSQGMFNITLMMNLNSLLPFSAEGLERKALEDGLNSANIKIMQLIQKTEIEVYQTVLLLEKSRTNMEALQLTENMALRSYQLTQQAFRNGLAELLEVQSALIEYQKAQNEVLKENFNYLSGLIDLEYAIGVPFGTLSGEK
jgi:outer membrane protein TolC